MFKNRWNAVLCYRLKDSMKYVCKGKKLLCQMEFIKIYYITQHGKTQIAHIQACDSRWTSLWFWLSKTDGKYDSAIACIYLPLQLIHAFQLEIHIFASYIDRISRPVSLHKLCCACICNRNKLSRFANKRVTMMMALKIGAYEIRIAFGGIHATGVDNFKQTYTLAPTWMWVLNVISLGY